MPSVQVLLLVLLLATDSLCQQASEPNCTGIADFQDCQGNTDNFCPTGISCQCKNEEPFCRCHYYRVGWRDYWYMGPKCNQLWNTLDLILVTVLPAVALSFVVGVICQCIYYCKGRKNTKQANAPHRNARHNPAFTAEPTDNLGYVSQHQPRDGWVGQNMRLPKAQQMKPDFNPYPTPSQLEHNSPMSPVRRPDPLPLRDYSPTRHPQQYDRYDHPSYNLPYPDYAEERRYPRYDVSHNAARPRDDPNDERSVRPYGLGHSGNRYNY
ncbi:uncharacterized protein LOC112944492 [Nothoprocta perdicaria]|uniref:uncharacterized protein LOC112944492 n=1 Tax=Nothoprocta perdicaria TaxID=30464 RepID=UPI000E1B8C84|nr:uncharacterized protein LOC112944492 [Nothoprocta perdicaria]